MMRRKTEPKRRRNSSHTYAADEAPRPATPLDIENAYRINHIREYVLKKTPELRKDVKNLLQPSEIKKIDGFRRGLAEITQAERRRRAISIITDKLADMELRGRNVIIKK